MISFLYSFLSKSLKISLINVINVVGTHTKSQNKPRKFGVYKAIFQLGGSKKIIRVATKNR